MWACIFQGSFSCLRYAPIFMPQTPKCHKIVNFHPAVHIKGCLISEGILSLVPLPTKGAKSLSWSENLNKLLTVMGGKFKFSAYSIWHLLLAMRPKSKHLPEIKPPLTNFTLKLLMQEHQISNHVSYPKFPWTLSPRAARYWLKQIERKTESTYCSLKQDFQKVFCFFSWSIEVWVYYLGRP